MVKIQFVLAVVLVAALALAQAEPQRAARYSRNNRQRTRYLARQQAEDGAPGAPAAPEAPVTPYPSADELKPAVPFDEGVAAVPDEVYGPPESALNVPDETYGPPEVAENDLPPAEEPAAEAFPAPLDEQQARLVAARRANLRQRQLAYRQAVAARAARPLKYRAAAVKRSA